MTAKEQLLEEIERLDAQLMDRIVTFWHEYGHFGTWQFWMQAVSLLAPLALTFFFIDRRKIFRIAFFGYTFHMFMVYIDVLLTRNNYWDHPYQLFPYLPVSIPVDGALVPIAFMFAYQYALNRNRNFFVVVLVTAVLLTTVAWIWEWLGLLVLQNGMRIYHIYLLQVGLSVVSYGFVRLFEWMKGTAQTA